MLRFAVLLITLGLALISTSACLPGTPTPPPHVLLISVDSMRADRLALYNQEDGVPTPHLEALAAEGIRYDDAWATSPWTAPSMVSIMTGLYPPAHGVVYRDDTTPPGLPTLPRLLEAEGYRLGNFTFFSQISYFRNLGLPEPPKGLGHDGLAAAFERWLDAAPAGKNARVFAWLHLLEPHLPYGASGYKATEVQVPGSTGLEASQLQAAVPLGSVEFVPGDREKLLALYDADVARMDAALGAILEVLDRRGMREDTLIAVVADHGEELLEDGFIGHASTAVDAKLLPQIVRIPMILAGPGVVRGTVRHERVQGLDLFPTLLRLAGVEPPRAIDGRVLPGLAGWAPVGWRLGSPLRERAFFDSSPGGNLTPEDQRDERVQGVTDGDCLLETRLGPKGATPIVRWVDPTLRRVDCAARRSALEDDLARWREAQGRRRLEMLQGGAREAGPDVEAVGGYAETLSVARPQSGAVITWSDGRGQLVLEWEPPPGAERTEKDGEELPPGDWWVQYEVGRGLRSASGTFRLEQERVVFGPFPHGFWDDLASYNPFRFRVLDPAGERRSPWIEFRLRSVTPAEQAEQAEPVEGGGS